MASKSKKGLGRGLGALFDDSKSEKSSEGFDFLSDLSDTEIADSDSIKMIKVRDIEPNKIRLGKKLCRGGNRIMRDGFSFPQHQRRTCSGGTCFLHTGQCA